MVFLITAGPTREFLDPVRYISNRSSGKMGCAVAESALRHGREGKKGNIVVDPVMIATSGAKLLSDDAVAAMRDLMLPVALLATPNIPEAETILDERIKNRADMESAAREITKRCGCATLVKGGHIITAEPNFHPTLAEDVLFADGEIRWYSLPAIRDPLSTHGTGCSLSAAIAAALACGADLPEAVGLGKQFVHDSIVNAVRVGARTATLNPFNNEIHEKHKRFIFNNGFVLQPIFNNGKSGKSGICMLC
jgi:hydroxymethylpyrimidine kinase/phosphomethylpyrimidine kinase